MILIIGLLAGCAEQQASAEEPTIIQIDRAHVEDPDAPAPEAVLDQDVQPIAATDPGDAVYDLITTDDVLLSEVLASVPAEDRIWVELAVKQTISLLAENGRLNPGQGAVPGKLEKLIGLLLVLAGWAVSVWLRMRTQAPARLGTEQIDAIRAPLYEQIKGMHADLEGMRADRSALAALTGQLQTKDERLAIVEEAYRSAQQTINQHRQEQIHAAQTLEGASTVSDGIEKTRRSGVEWIGS